MQPIRVLVVSVQLHAENACNKIPVQENRLSILNYELPIGLALSGGKDQLNMSWVGGWQDGDDRISRIQLFCKLRFEIQLITTARFVCAIMYKYHNTTQH